MKASLFLACLLLLNCSIRAQDQPILDKLREPTLEEIKSGKCTKDDFIKYLTFKKNTLPDLYLEFDSINMKLHAYSWGRGFSDRIIVVPSLNWEMHARHEPSSKHLTFIELKMSKKILDTLSIRDLNWLKAKIKSDTGHSVCLKISNHFRDVYVVFRKPENVIAYKINLCLAANHDDEIVK